MKKFFENIKDAFSKKKNIEIQVGTVSIDKEKISVNISEEISNPELFPTLFIPEHPNLKVLINGNPSTGEVILSKGVQVDIIFTEQIISEPSLFYVPNVSDDKMSVSIKKNINFGQKWSIQDISETNKAEIIVTQVNFAPDVSNSEEIKYLLDSEGFKGEYIFENIDLLCTSVEEIELEVLKGTVPMEGKPAFYQLKFFSDGINFIQNNDVIATLENEIPPIDGLDVFGNVIPMENNYTLPKIGANVTEDNGVLRAGKDGRLIFDENQIEVIPQLIIQGDLIEGDGPIIFNDGDVVIEGRVLEKSFIKASGAIYAKNGIYGSTVISGMGVFVDGNISSSQIYCGIPLLLFKKAYRFLNVLNDKINHAQYTSTITYLNSKYVSEMFSIYFLAEKYLDEDMKNFYSSLLLFKKEVEETIASLKNHFTHETDAEDFDHLKETIIDLISKIDPTTFNASSQIKTDNVTNSTLYASGPIEVVGDGTYLSFMESAISIKVKGKVNGGTLIAETSIEVGEFKSYNTTDFGLIVFDHDGLIKIQKRYPDTTVKVGDNKDTTYDMHYNVVYRNTKPKA